MSSTRSGTYTAFSPSCCSAALWMAGLRLRQRQRWMGQGKLLFSLQARAPTHYCSLTQRRSCPGSHGSVNSLFLPPWLCSSSCLPCLPPPASSHLWLTGLPTMPMTAVSCRCRFSPYMPLSCCSVGWPGAAWQTDKQQAVDEIQQTPAEQQVATWQHKAGLVRLGASGPPAFSAPTHRPPPPPGAPDARSGDSAPKVRKPPYLGASRRLIWPRSPMARAMQGTGQVRSTLSTRHASAGGAGHVG